MAKSTMRTAVSAESVFEEILQCAKTNNAEKLSSIRSLHESLLEKVVDMQDDHDKYTPLIWAAKDGNVDVTRLLCEMNATVDFENGWNSTTALHRASEKGMLDWVKILLEFNADLRKKNNHGMTALMLAAENHRNDVLVVLLAKNRSLEDAESNSSSKKKKRQKKPDMSRSSYVDLQNEYEYTALILAASAGNTIGVRILLENDADYKITNKFGKNALIMACENGKSAVASMS
jgi:ankyrin repeat protein